MIQILNKYGESSTDLAKVIIVDKYGNVKKIKEICDKTYIFTQSIPAFTWYVTHNLNKFPSVTVTLSSGQTGFADVQYIDINNVIINFAGEETGKAYLN